jgi:hypothetical protein
VYLRIIRGLLIAPGPEDNLITPGPTGNVDGVDLRVAELPPVVVLPFRMFPTTDKTSHILLLFVHVDKRRDQILVVLVDLLVLLVRLAVVVLVARLDTLDTAQVVEKCCKSSSLPVDLCSAKSISRASEVLIFLSSLNVLT